MIDTDLVSLMLTDRFGLPVQTASGRDREGWWITIRPDGVDRTITFSIRATLGWRRLTAEFLPGDYAKSLIGQMQASGMEQRIVFSVFAEDLSAKGAILTVRINDTDVSAHEPQKWPSRWSSIILRMQKPALVLGGGDESDIGVVMPWLYGFTGMCLALLPLEQVEDQDNPGEEEGGAVEIAARRYERSRINRAACIQVHGTACSICGFSFRDRYGDIGAGFIHVHHIVPLAAGGGAYVCDPARDLIPVCPNCHAMLHRKHPPLMPDDLASIISGADGGLHLP